ncbi:hypothetical protein G8764_15585 [Pseudomaricurvus alcaniphilus]|uniref:hypothetical protein n=1 Tax=Pseudomaricurvus alcaniphilus TaxID=1166482 RepID=UPI00140D1CE2|nr:hypothetical protein [Pseudomaricurvus alcaniphilus]NHN38731.1 hypothetical protein [Pseudomaricurvus alcaniphilus]
MASKLRDLVVNIARALQFSPPNYLRSLLGNTSSWKRSNNANTELQLMEREHFPANLATARAILLPAWPGKPDWLPPLVTRTGLFRTSSTGLYPATSSAGSNYPNESWMFVNGICADRAVAELNADYLYRLFGRQLTLLHNQTHGFMLDLAECAVGKGWLGATEAVQKLFPAFYSELKRPDIDRVVLIAHSQGTILAAVFVAMLRQLLEEQVATQASDTEAESSPEARCAADLLKSSLASLHKPIVRVMQQASGPAGGLLANLDQVSRSGKQQLVDSVQYWLDWSADSVLGLPALTLAELKKLEIYCFATCATDMPVLLEGQQPAPYMEHFGNSKDLVARLGLFAPPSGPGSTRIAGQRFVCEDGWGHLLNAHYLQPLQRQWQGDGEAAFKPQAGQRSSSGKRPAQSRLKKYYQQANPAGLKVTQINTDNEALPST